MPTRPLLRALLLLASWTGAAPGQTDSSLSGALRGYFESLDAGAPAVIADQLLHEGKLLDAVYRDRGHAPLWTGDGPLAAQADDLLAAIEDASSHGLNTAHYHLQALRTLPRHGAGALAFEVLASDAYLRQVRHRSSGAVQPQRLDPEWHLLRPEVAPGWVLERTAAGTTPLRTALDALWPNNGEYRQLVAARSRILELGELHMPRVPDGPLLRPGNRGARVLALKDRLLGPGDHDDIFDAALEDAVRAFQRGAALNPDGVVGPATLELLNASRASWIDRIDANLERWRWLPAELPETYVRVNIAAFALRVVARGEDALRMDVIVGRPYRRTPVFTETIKYIVFNPYWYVPHRIAVQDKLPALRADAAALVQQGFEVRQAGAETFATLDTVDWLGLERGRFPFALRQRPGPDNALGQVKFMLPNPFDVYLHDTPGRTLFNQAERALSSGCVRLAKPLELAEWMLQNDGQPELAANIHEILHQRNTRTTYLRNPVPTFMVYFTAFTDDHGEVVFRRDLYGRDAAIVGALRTPAS